MNFRTRILLTLTLVLTLGFGAGGTLLVSSSFAAALAEEEAGARRDYEMARGLLAVLYEAGDTQDSAALAASLEQMAGQGVGGWAALRLYSRENIIFAHGSSAELLDADMPTPPDEMALCACRRVEINGAHYLQIASRMQAGVNVLTLEGQYDITAAYDQRQGLQRLYLRIYLVIAAAGLAVSLVISGLMTRPLEQLTLAARQIADGELDRRVGLRRRDEIGLLARDFDRMADRLAGNIRRLEGELDRQERFMGAFAHELKTPMTSIIGYADLLRQDGLPAADRMEAADYIFREGRRLEQLSFKLLDLLLLEQDKLAPAAVSLPEFVNEIKALLEPALAGKGIALDCQCQPGQAFLEPDLVKSLLYNLVDNAAKAMDGPGTITLKAGPLPGGARFAVRDTGRGMPPQELERITEAFYRVDKARSRRQGGAGLGLALCSRIAALHQGRLTFRSEPGKGTLVVAELYAPEVEACRAAD